MSAHADTAHDPGMADHRSADRRNGGSTGRRRLELRPDELRRRLDPKRFRFASTEEVEPQVGTIGQPRALDAIEYGLGTTARGFNLVVPDHPDPVGWFRTLPRTNLARYLPGSTSVREADTRTVPRAYGQAPGARGRSRSWRQPRGRSRPETLLWLTFLVAFLR